MPKVWLATLVSAITGASLLAFSLHRRPVVPARSASSTRAPLYYRDPMHPSYTSDKPGVAPDCGMTLEPVYSDERVPKALEGSTINSLNIQAIRDGEELVGIKLGRVDEAPASRTLRTLGQVVLDDNRVFPVIAGGDGWVNQLAPSTTVGDVVKQGQTLLSVYGRDYTTAQRTYLYALQAAENSPKLVSGSTQDLSEISLQEARLVLRNMGLADSQIDQLKKDRRVLLDLKLTAPADGVVVSRNALSKQRFERGFELFRIADLTHVWVTTNLFGQDAQYLTPNTVAVVSLQQRPEVRLKATVESSLAQFDPVSRSLKLRLECANPRFVLRPNMYVDVSLSISLPKTLTVPADAVVESGSHEVVFVKRQTGGFEARTVQTGWRTPDRVQIVHGLTAGESIVVSGNFLLDSERRMRQNDPRGHN